MTRALLVALLVASPALAYESVCFQYADESKEPALLDAASRTPCTPAGGPNTARHRWVGPLDEHRALFERARAAAGIPASASATFALDAYTADAGSLIPVPFEAATRLQKRHLTVGELAQLPDYSYALWDWATGHETCPIPDAGDATACHDFATHMGPVNSNHFVPQSNAFYARYHQLALDRADACVAMQVKLAGDGARFTDFLRQCELEALALEAVAQHYLQDAWSTGHMWERWGSPEGSDFPGTGDEPRDRAVLVSLISGLIHGSRGVLQKFPGWTTFDVNDALCAPQPTVQYVHDGALHRGLGDDYLDQLPSVLTASGDFAHQATQLMSCSVTSLNEVYLRAGKQHGPNGAMAAGLQSVVVNSDACFGQRVTNAALSEGAALQLRVAGQQVSLPLDARFVGWLVPRVARSTGDASVAPKLRNEFRFSMMRAMTKLRLAAKDRPEATDIANGGMGPLVGVAPNGSFLTRPVSYVEPALPWPGAATRPAEEKARATALARLFHKAHAADWCATTTQPTLDALKAHATDASLDADGKLAACGACAEVMARHVRLGAVGAYDTSREPLCALLVPGAPVVYQAPVMPGDAAQAARAACGCP